MNEHSGIYAEAYESLIKTELQQYLPGESISEMAPTVSEKDLFRLLGHASSLAFSEHADDRKKAYEISSRIAQLTSVPNPEILQIISLI